MAHLVKKDATHTAATALVAKHGGRGGSMTPMHYSAKEQKQMDKPVPTAADKGPRYPYGLSIELEHHSLEKLGMKKLPKAGTHMTLHARVKVRRAEESQDESGPRRSMSLQVTHLKLKGGRPVPAGAHPGDGRKPVTPPAPTKAPTKGGY